MTSEVRKIKEIMKEEITPLKHRKYKHNDKKTILKKGNSKLTPEHSALKERLGNKDEDAIRSRIYEKNNRNPGKINSMKAQQI